MLKAPKHAVPLTALAVTLLLGASTASFADFVRLPESGKGTQSGPTIKGDKNTPKRTPTHGVGTLADHNPNIGPLKGPEMRESGMGKLVGGDKQGDKNTPKREPTFSVTPK